MTPIGETEFETSGETQAAPEPAANQATETQAQIPARPAAQSQGAQEWVAGDVILEQYEITGVLGEGGMGKVYKAYHRGWNTDLAVKSPRPEILSQAGGVENFIRECETWVNLGLHPHIVSCYYVRTVDSIPRVFAEYVAGGSLKDWIDRRKLYEGGPQKALKCILDVAIQFAWGLHYAHEAGLVHQDVKPANVMLTPGGDAKVTDFGLAKARGAVEGAPRTAGGQSILVSSGGMTPAYCSPEQAQHQPLTRKTDIWSWGVSVLEMFTGEVTWLAGQAAAEALAGYLENGPEDPVIPTLPPALADLLEQCFQKNVEARPRDLLEIAVLLHRIYEQVCGQAYERQIPNMSALQADSLNNKALSLYDLGRTAEAEALWQKNLEANPGHIESTYNLGLVQWRSAKIDDAGLLRALGAATLSSGDWRLNWLQSQVHLERGDADRAFTVLNELPTDFITRPEVAATRRQAETAQGSGHRLRHTIRANTGSVAAVCLSADGRFILSATGGRSGREGIKLWDAATGKAVRTFAGDTKPARAIGFSADGRYALSGGMEHTIRYWEVGTGECFWIFEGHTGWVTSVCMSNDSRYALSGSRDKTLKLWDIESGNCLRTLQGHLDVVSSVCLSRDSRYALSGSGDSTLKLWDAATGQCLRTFKGHTDWVSSVCLSEDGRYALSGSRDNTLRLWDLATGECLRIYRGHTGWVNSACLGGNGRYALSGSEDQTLKLWNVATGGCLRTLEGHTGGVSSVYLSQDGRSALSGSTGDDNTIKLWDIAVEYDWKAQFAFSHIVSSEADLTVKRLMKEAQSARQRNDPVAEAGALRQARSVPGYENNAEIKEAWVKLYPKMRRSFLRSGSLVQTLDVQTVVFSIAISKDGRYLLSRSGYLDGSSQDTILTLWDLTTYECVNRAVLPTPALGDISMSGDGKYLLLAWGKPLRLWDVAKKQFVPVVPLRTEWVGTVSMSMDGRYALGESTLDAEEAFNLYDLATGKCLRTFTKNFGIGTSGSFTKDGCQVFSNTGNKYTLWDLATGNCLKTFEVSTSAANGKPVRAEGLYAFTGRSDHLLRMWDGEAGECVRVFAGHTGTVNSACLSADGRFALSGGKDKTIKVWDVATSRCLRTFEGHTDDVRTVCLSPDERFVFSGSLDKTIKVWELDWELEDIPQDQPLAPEKPAQPEPESTPTQTDAQVQETWLSKWFKKK